MRSAQGEQESMVPHWFGKMDTDGDDQITREEWKVAWTTGVIAFKPLPPGARAVRQDVNLDDVDWASV